MRVLSREEQERFISYLQKDLDPCRFGILLALCTGIRIGELCALRWEYVSTRDKAIKIVETLQRLRDTSVSQNARTRIVIGPPKSDTSVQNDPYDGIRSWALQAHEAAKFSRICFDRNGRIHGATGIAVSIGEVHAGMWPGGGAFSYTSAHICDTCR